MNSKKGKQVYLYKERIDEYLDLVKKVKTETSYQGMSFSRMCDIGCEAVKYIYNTLSEEEKSKLLGIEEFNALMRKKLGIKKED